MRLIKLVGLALSMLCMFGRGSLIDAQQTIRVPQEAPSIQGAIDAAHNGDLILVSPGVYAENLILKGKLVTVSSGATSLTDAVNTIIMGAGDGPVVTFADGESAATVLNGFTITGGHANAARAQGGGVFINGASPTLTNNVITKNYGCGVLVENGGSPSFTSNIVSHSLFLDDESKDGLCPVSDGSPSGTGVVLVGVGDVQLIGNIVEDNALKQLLNAATPTSGAGISVDGANSLLLQGNIVRNNHAGAATALNVVSSVPRIVLINNLFYGNSSPPDIVSNVQVFITGSYSGGVTKLVEVNNTFYGLSESLILNFASSLIANNVFVNTNVAKSSYSELGAGLNCGSLATSSTFDIHNNDVFNAGVPVPSGCSLNATNLQVDPQLRDPENGDLRERVTSPLIVAGDINAPLIPPTDLDAKARTVCNTIDIGAYELRPHPPVSLTSSANPTPGGGSITFTARLTGNCNIPTGTVTFLDGGSVIGTGVVNSSGVATLTTAFLVVGQHDITANYPGDFNFEDSTSAVLVQIITGAPTDTSLSVLPNPASALSSITMRSLVHSSYGIPTGSVVFSAAGKILGTTTLDNAGNAVLTVSSLGTGTYPIIATYTADTLFQRSSSPQVLEVVTGLDTLTSIIGSPNPGSLNQAVTFVAVVKAGQGNGTIPAGTVTFLDGAVTLGIASLNVAGQASITTSALAIGPHTITAHYDGSSNFNPSSASLLESVTTVSTALALTATPNPSNTGQTITLTASATSSLVGIVPAGSVTFRDGPTLLATRALNGAGVATYTTNFSVGTHALQASLVGSPTFGGSISPVVNEVVLAYDFALQTSRPSISLPSGDLTTSTVMVTPIGGFAGNVMLNCEQVPDHTQCIFPDGATVSLSAGPKAVRLVFNTSDLYGYGDQVSRNKRDSGTLGGILLAGLLFPTLGCVGFLGRQRRRGSALWTVTGIAILLTGMQACSGKLPAKAVPGSYIVTLKGVSTDGTNMQHQFPIQLSITP